MKTNGPNAVPVLLSLALCVVLGATDAQARIRPGIELGVNFSSLSYDKPDETPIAYWDLGWRNSFTGGATLEIPIREHLAIMTGVRYVQQGNQVELKPGAFGFPQVREIRFHQDYVALPLMLETRPLPSRNVLISFGPEAEFLVSAHSVIYYRAPVGGSDKQDISKSMESVNLTVNVGVGFELPFENHVALLSLRYTHGVTDAAKEDSWASTWKTRGVEALVGFRW